MENKSEEQGLLLVLESEEERKERLQSHPFKAVTGPSLVG